MTIKEKHSKVTHNSRRANVREERGKGVRARGEEDMTEQDLYVLPIDNYVDSEKANASVATGKSAILLLGECQEEENCTLEGETDYVSAFVAN